MEADDQDDLEKDSDEELEQDETDEGSDHEKSPVSDDEEQDKANRERLTAIKRGQVEEEAPKEPVRRRLRIDSDEED